MSEIEKGFTSAEKFVLRGIWNLESEIWNLENYFRKIQQCKPYSNGPMDWFWFKFCFDISDKNIICFKGVVDLISKGFSEKSDYKDLHFTYITVSHRGNNTKRKECNFRGCSRKKGDTKGTRQLNCNRQHALKRGYLNLKSYDQFYVPSETEFTRRTHGQNINKFIHSTMCTEQVLEDTTVNSFSPCYWKEIKAAFFF